MNARLSRYIGVHQLKALAIVLGVVACIVVIVDFAGVAARATSFPGFTAARALASTLMETPTHLFVILPLATVIAAMGSTIALARRSEITVMRAAGLSPWQILGPAGLAAFAVGVAVTLASPLTAAALSVSRGIDVDMRGAVLQARLRLTPQWYAQSDAEGLTAVGAARADLTRAALNDVVFLRFAADGRFVERVDAARAEWSDGAWHLERAMRSRPATAPEPLALAAFAWKAGPQVLARGFSDIQQIGFFDLPSEIETAKGAGMSTARHEVRFHVFLALPALLGALAMAGGAVALRMSGRFGAGPLIVAGLALCFALHVTTVLFNAMAVVGALPAVVGAWGPVVAVALVGGLLVLHREETQGGGAAKPQAARR